MLGWIDIPENQFPDLFTHFLSGLPIEKDYAENQWVIKSILRLLVNKQHLVTFTSFSLFLVFFIIFFFQKKKIITNIFDQKVSYNLGIFQDEFPLFNKINVSGIVPVLRFSLGQKISTPHLGSKPYF